MTRDEIIAMAHEAGIPQGNLSALAHGCLETGAELLERFAALVMTKERNRIADEAKSTIKRAEARGAATEREACALVCDELANPISKRYVGYGARTCATAIRARN